MAMRAYIQFTQISPKLYLTLALGSGELKCDLFGHGFVIRYAVFLSLTVLIITSEKIALLNNVFVSDLKDLQCFSQLRK